MNRLIIVGNGFDLARNLKTSYSHFIIWYLSDALKKAKLKEIDNENLKIARLDIYKQKTIRRVCSKHDLISMHDVPTDTLLEKLPFFWMQDDFPASDLHEILQIKEQTILQKSCHDLHNKGWADLERSYYELLVYTSIDPNLKKALGKVKSINAEMAALKAKLIEYLKIQVEDINSYLSLEKLFTPFTAKDLPIEAKNQSKLIGTVPEKVVILNFNYTNCLENQNKNVEEIHIHGKLNNEPSIVFGYGDELDSNYKTLEMKTENVWLEHFKSFFYVRNSQYNRLLGFLENNEFQICVAGHSCGLSDKTLLNHIFQHDYCRSIKILYYEYKKDDKERDNFDEMIFDISRIMDNKLKLRGRVVNREFLEDSIDTYLTKSNLRYVIPKRNNSRVKYKSNQVLK